MNKTRVVLFSGNPHCFSKPLVEFVTWLDELLEDVAVCDRPNVTIDISTLSEYGDYYPELEIAYWRALTAEELATEAANRSAQQRAAEASERAMLAALQAKYGSGA